MTDLKILQERVFSFTEENNLNTNQEIRALDLVSEIGELSKEIIKSTDYGKKEKVITENTKSEMGDVLFSLIILANSNNIDLEEALLLVLEKYNSRLKKGGAGSENE